MIDLTGTTYARRSQQGDNLSCENQIERCQQFVPEIARQLTARYGDDVRIDIKHVFKDEGQSGQDFERTGYSQVRRLIANRQTDLLIIYAVNRLGRTEDVTDMFLERRFCLENDVQVWVENRRREITAADQSTLIEFFFESLWARKELEETRMRTIQGRWIAHKVDPKRLAFGGRPFYGVALDENKHFVIEEDQATVIRQMYDWVLRKYMTALDIALRLELLGIATPSGTGQWSARTVLRILENPGIAGLGVRVHPKDADTQEERTILIPTPSIIPASDFERVQRILGGRKQARTGKRRVYLLSELLRCSICGRHFIGSGNKYGAWYKCVARSRPKELGIDPCSMTIIPKEIIEAQAMELAANYAEHAATLAEASKHGVDRREQVADAMVTIRHKLEEAKQAQTRFATEWAYRNIDQATLATAMEQNRERISQLEQRLMELQLEDMILKQQSQGVNPLASIAAQPLHTLSAEGQRGIIRCVIRSIDVYLGDGKQVRLKTEYYPLDAALSILIGRNTEVLSNFAMPVPRELELTTIRW